MSYMKRTSKFLSLLLALAMVCSLFVPAMAAEKEEGIVVLYTNDIHCTSDDGLSYAAIAGYKAQMEDTYGTGNVTLVDTGDAIQGGILGSMSSGSWIIDIMNAVGYDLAIPGNHEFDFGMETFLDIVENQAEFPYLSCNFVDADGNPVLEAYQIISYGDVDVAYVGISTPETLTKSAPAYFQDDAGNYIYGFCQGNDGQELYDQVQEAVDAARAAGADYVVALAHLGVDAQSSPWMSTEVIANTTGIDVMLDGHSHSTVASETVKNADGEDVLLSQTGTKAESVGKLVIAPDGTMTTELVALADVDTTTQAYADAETFVKGIQAEYTEKASQVVATSSVDLTVNDPATGSRAVRSAETNLGDLCADAYRIVLGADIGWVNGGGVRDNIAAGDITYGDIIAVHPFGNLACLVEVTGQQILDALELGSMQVGVSENGGFLQVSGIKYTIDPTIPTSVVLDDAGNFIEVSGDRRVSDVQVLDSETGEYAPIDPAATYTLASHNYMLKNGGDGYAMFGADNVTILQDEVMVDNEVLINYIRDSLGGVVGEEYADPYGQGRITIKYKGVEAGTWYVEAARYVMDNGIMTSAGSAGFLPNGTVTRGTVFQTLYNMAGQPEVTEAASFTDVAGKWYADAAAWAEDEGLTSGTGTGLFNGDAAITRQELAKIFADYTASKNIVATEDVDLSTYADADEIPGWASESMATAVSLGILKGSNNQLNPAGTAVRSELAQILLNISKLTPAYTEETVTIEVAAQNGVPAHTMTAIVTVPTSATEDNKVPGVVMLHGTGSNLHEVNGAYDMAAAEMAAQGLATIRFNFQGIDEGTEKLYVNYSYTSANIDAKAAADYLAGLEVVDGDKLGVMGWSQGGTNAFLAAAAYPDTFKSVVTWAGALDLTVMFEDFDAAYAEAEKNGSFTMEFDWRTALPTGFQWFKDVKDTDVLEEIKTIEAPILTINGAADTVVDPASGKTVVDAARNEASENLIIENCDHTLTMFSGDYTAINQVISATADFFVDTLSGTAAADQAA